MPLFLYSIANVECKNLPNGVWGEKIVCEEVDHLYAVFSKIKAININQELSKFSLDAGKKHPAFIFQQIVSEIHSEADTIPIRFGTIIKDKVDLQYLLRQNRFELRKQLNQFGQCIEHTLVFKKEEREKRTENTGWQKLKSPGASYLSDKYKKYKGMIKNESFSKLITTLVSDLFFKNLLDIKVVCSADYVKVHVLSHKSWTPDQKSLIQLRDKLALSSFFYLGQFPPSHFISFSLHNQ